MAPAMLRAIWRFQLLGAILLIALGVSACGGGGASGSVVAQVGSVPITKATLAHWTATFVRGDYYSTMSAKAPAGLASDPVNYASCVSAAKTIPATTRGGKARLTAAQLEAKCHELYRAVELEALSYLISAIVSDRESTALGHPITEADIDERIAQTQHETYPKKGQLEAYLANKGWSRADLRYIVRRNLAVGEITKVFGERAKGGGEKAVAAQFVSLGRAWTEKTTCMTGYRVERCRGYKAPAAQPTSPAVLFEQMAGLSS